MFELHHATWNSDYTGLPDVPTPGAPWRPAFWTMGKLTWEWNTQEHVRQVATLCKNGGRLKDALDPRIYALGGWELFPNEVVPKNTLIIADYEGRITLPYAAMLCQTIRAVTPQYAQYPGFIADDGFNYPWIQRYSEPDLIVAERMFVNAAKKGTWQHPLRMALGSYILVDFDLFPPNAEYPDYHEYMFRAWALCLAAIRRHYHDVKVIALVHGMYSDMQHGPISADERQRLARFVLSTCDGVWAWGYRQHAKPLMDDIEVLLKEPLHRFPGQENWVVG